MAGNFPNGRGRSSPPNRYPGRARGSGNQNSDEESLYEPDDCDMDKTQEVMVSGSQRDPIQVFCILAEFVSGIMNLYTDKLDTMKTEDLLEEARQEALHQKL